MTNKNRIRRTHTHRKIITDSEVIACFLGMVFGAALTLAFLLAGRGH